MNEIIRKFLPGPALPMNADAADKFASDKPRRVVVRCSSSSVDRMGDVIEQDGIGLDSYRKNPVVLWGHDHNSPIARCVEIGVQGGMLTATVDFPSPGASRLADTVYSLVRSGVVNATSVGIGVTESVPLDKGLGKKGPQRITKSDLWEFSFVSVPANPDALVVWRHAVDGDEKAWKAHRRERAKRMAEVEVLVMRGDDRMKSVFDSLDKITRNWSGTVDWELELDRILTLRTIAEMRAK